MPFHSRLDDKILGSVWLKWSAAAEREKSRRKRKVLLCELPPEMFNFLADELEIQMGCAVFYPENRGFAAWPNRP